MELCTDTHAVWCNAPFLTLHLKIFTDISKTRSTMDDSTTKYNINKTQKPILKATADAGKHVTSFGTTTSSNVKPVVLDALWPMFISCNTNNYNWQLLQLDNNNNDRTCYVTVIPVKVRLKKYKIHWRINHCPAVAVANIEQNRHQSFQQWSSQPITWLGRAQIQTKLNQ